MAFLYRPDIIQTDRKVTMDSDVHSTVEPSEQEVKDRNIAGNIGEQAARVLWLAVHDNEENTVAAGRKLGILLWDTDNGNQPD